MAEPTKHITALLVNSDGHTEVASINHTYTDVLPPEWVAVGRRADGVLNTGKVQFFPNDKEPVDLPGGWAVFKATGRPATDIIRYKLQRVTSIQPVSLKLAPLPEEDAITAEEKDQRKADGGPAVKEDI